MEASPKFAQFRSVVSGSRLLQSQPDGVLSKLALRGNAGAFEALYNRHHGALYGFIYHLLGRGASAEDAEDIAQDVFSTAFNKLAERREDASFKSWLFTIARNRTYDQIRGRRPQVSDLIEHPVVAAAGPEQKAEGRADLAWLVAALAQLPVRQREALVMREMGGLSYGEIAVSMNTTVPGVKQLINRARGSLNEATGGPEIRSRHLRKELAALVPVIPLAITSAGVAAFGVAGTTVGVAAGAGGVSGTVKLAAVMLAAAAIGGGAVGLSESQQSEGELRTAGGAVVIGDSTGAFDDSEGKRGGGSDRGDDRDGAGGDSGRNDDDGRDGESRSDTGRGDGEEDRRGDDGSGREREDSEESDRNDSSSRESGRAESGEDDHGSESSSSEAEEESPGAAEPNEPETEDVESGSDSGTDGESGSESGAESQSSEPSAEITEPRED